MVLTSLVNKNPMLLSNMPISGWSGPNPFSQVMKERSYSVSSSPRLPWRRERNQKKGWWSWLKWMSRAPLLIFDTNRSQGRISGQVTSWSCQKHFLTNFPNLFRMRIQDLGHNIISLPLPRTSYYWRHSDGLKRNTGKSGTLTCFSNSNAISLGLPAKVG